MFVPSKDPKIAAEYPRPTREELRRHRRDWTDPFFGVNHYRLDKNNPDDAALLAKLLSIDNEPGGILRALGFKKGEEPKEDKKDRERLKAMVLKQDEEEAPHGGVLVSEGPKDEHAPTWGQRRALSGANPMQASRPSGVAEMLMRLESMGILPAPGRPGGRLNQLLGVQGGYFGSSSPSGYRQSAVDWEGK